MSECAFNSAVLAIVGLLIVVLVVMLVGRTRDGFVPMSNMSFQYETQDNYHNVPESWPIPYTPHTAIFARKRDAIAREKGYYLDAYGYY
jgi:hypothetical protein